MYRAGLAVVCGTAAVRLLSVACQSNSSKRASIAFVTITADQRKQTSGSRRRIHAYVLREQHAKVRFTHSNYEG